MVFFWGEGNIFVVGSFCGGVAKAGYSIIWTLRLGCTLLVKSCLGLFVAKTPKGTRLFGWFLCNQKPSKKAFLWVCLLCELVLFYFNGGISGFPCVLYFRPLDFLRFFICSGLLLGKMAFVWGRTCFENMFEGVLVIAVKQKTTNKVAWTFVFYKRPNVMGVLVAGRPY